MPKVPKPLTETQIAKVKPHPTKSQNLFDGSGLYLLVKPSGVKLWRMIYAAPDGRRRTLSFGVWPGTSLETARNLRAGALSVLKAGRDPADNRKTAREPIRGLFGEIAKDWLTTMKPSWGNEHGNDYTHKLDFYILPILGNLPIKEIDRAAIQAVLDPMAAGKKFNTLKKVKGIISAVLQFAPPELGVIDWTKQIGRQQYPAPPTKNRAALTTPAEIAGLLRAITSYRDIGYITALAMKFLALTFARPGEVRLSEWGEIDEKDRLWRIPAEKMKMKRPHFVPLANQTLYIIEELRSITCHRKYLFPSTHNITQPISKTTVLAALRRLGFEKTDMCAHGFRAMAATVLNEKGWIGDWIERQLAHVEGGVRAAYNHTDYLDGRRRMMDWWGAYLEALENDTSPPELKN